MNLIYTLDFLWHRINVNSASTHRLRRGRHLFKSPVPVGYQEVDLSTDVVFLE
jgi:hypothetical protein